MNTIELQISSINNLRSVKKLILHTLGPKIKHAQNEFYFRNMRISVFIVSHCDGYNLIISFFMNLNSSIINCGYF